MLVRSARRRVSRACPATIACGHDGALVSALSGDLRQLKERDQQAARPLLHEIVARLPNSAEAQALAQSYLRSLEAAPALEHHRAAPELDPESLIIRHQMGLCAVAGRS